MNDKIQGEQNGPVRMPSDRTAPWQSKLSLGCRAVLQAADRGANHALTHTVDEPRGGRRVNDRRVLNGIFLGFEIRCAVAGLPG